MSKTDAAAASATEQSPLLSAGGGFDSNGSAGEEIGKHEDGATRSVSWTLQSCLLLGEIAGQGVFALPLHFSRLGWL